MYNKSIFGALLTIIAAGFGNTPGVNPMEHTARKRYGDNSTSRQYHIDVHGSKETQKETIAAAKDKRWRKQQRNLNNYHKGGWVRNPIVGHQFLTEAS